MIVIRLQKTGPVRERNAVSDDIMRGLDIE